MLEIVKGIASMIFFFGTIITVLIIVSYNKLQGFRQDIREKASNLEVAISKKISMINQMIDLAKNYQQGEQFTQLKVSQNENASNLSNAYQQSGTVLTSVRAMANLFPDLKANEQYNHLSSSITFCENEIQARRIEYNDTVKVYNVTRVQVPTVLFAKFIGFQEESYLKLDTSGYSDPNTLKEFKTDDNARIQQMLDGNSK